MKKAPLPRPAQTEPTHPDSMTVAEVMQIACKVQASQRASRQRRLSGISRFRDFGGRA